MSLRKMVISMRKIEDIEEFLDFGGNELLSSLMEDESDRAQALDRLCVLLQKYSEAFWVKGRAGAYRYMIGKANALCYIKSKELDSTRLSNDEKERILTKINEYRKSGGNLSKYIKKVATIILAILIVAAAIWAVSKWVHSDEYLRRLYGAIKNQ